MKIAVWCPVLEVLSRNRDDMEVGRLVDRLILDLRARVSEAQAAGASVFLGPEFYFSIGIHNRLAVNGPSWRTDATMRFCFSAEDYRSINGAVTEMGNDQLAVIPGTVLWSDAANHSRNTAIYAGPATGEHHKKSLDQVERKMMMSPCASGPLPKGGSSNTFFFDGPGGRKFCLEICRDAVPGSEDVDISLITAYKLGAPILRQKSVVAWSDGDGGGGVIAPQAGDHAKIDRTLSAGFHVVDVSDAHLDALAAKRRAPASGSSGKWVPRHLRNK